MRTKPLYAIVLLLCSCGGGEATRNTIQNKGSDTLVNVAQAWAEKYRDVNPNLAVAVSGGGSGTGISAMINGTVDIANASRAMKPQEINMARSNGIDPIQHIVGYDALAVYLQPMNPLNEITFTQLSGIYGEGGTIDNWSSLDLEHSGCSNDEIVRISRQNNSGTYIYFKEAIMGKRDYKLGSRDMHGSKDVVDLVSKTPCAIGYSGLAYATSAVKIPCVRQEESGPCVRPSLATTIDRSYSIARPLYMYTSGQPTGAVKEYLDWIMSDEGQCIIQAKGYAPAHSISCN